MNSTFSRSDFHIYTPLMKNEVEFKSDQESSQLAKLFYYWVTKYWINHINLPILIQTSETVFYAEPVDVLLIIM